MKLAITAMHMDTSSMIAKGLLETNAVKISLDPPFTWASGIKSPIYCDNRILISHPEIRSTIVGEIMTKIDHFRPDYIAGTATAGIPWASFVAYQMKLPMVYVRPEPKGHGAGRQIEGYLPPGKKVVLIEDLFSTGGSALKVAKVLQDEGQAEVAHIIAIMTYEMERADQAFADAQISHSTLTDFSHVLEEVKKEGALNEEEIATVLEFSKDPAGWWERFGG